MEKPDSARFVWLTDISACQRLLQAVESWRIDSDGYYLLTGEAQKKYKKDLNDQYKEICRPFEVVLGPSGADLVLMYDPAKVRKGTHATRLRYHYGKAGAYTASDWEGVGFASDAGDSFYFGVDKDQLHSAFYALVEAEANPWAVADTVLKGTILAPLLEELKIRIRNTDPNVGSDTVTAGQKQIIVTNSEGLLESWTPCVPFNIQADIHRRRERMVESLKLVEKGLSLGKADRYQLPPRLFRCDNAIGNLQNAGVPQTPRSRVAMPCPDNVVGHQKAFLAKSNPLVLTLNRAISRWRANADLVFHSQAIVKCLLKALLPILTLLKEQDPDIQNEAVLSLLTNCVSMELEARERAVLANLIGDVYDNILKD